MNRIFIPLCLCFVLLSCTENGNNNFPPPSIAFTHGEGYVSADTTVKLNQEIRIGIESASNSESGLTLLHTMIDKDGELTRIDSGLNSMTLSLQKVLTKGTAARETWSFYTKDREGRQSDTVSITLFLDEESAYGPILRYDTIILGAQESGIQERMLSLPDAYAYSLENAAANQSSIWLLYYYDNIDADKNTIASPGANIASGIIDLQGWSVKNTSRFIQAENITEDVFSSSQNDSLILENSFEFASGKRKAKKLGAGDFYSFVTEDNRRGMIRVLDVEGMETGHIKFQLIVQE